MANEEKIRILDEQPAENAGSLLYIRTLAGSSDASKPTSLLANGSIFIETDTGKVFIFDEDNGWTEMHAGGGGSSLPAVTSADNGKVLAVENGAWAAADNLFVVAASGSPATIDKTASEISAAVSSGKDVVLVDGTSKYIYYGEDASYIYFQKQNYTVNITYAYINKSNNNFYTATYTKVPPAYQSDNGSELIAKNGAWTKQKKKFIVTLTPTAADFSGTMDKTVAEINAAYEAGQEIVFRVMMSATTHMDVACTAQYFDGSTYPSFNAYIVNNTSGALIFAGTVTTDDGTTQTYSTTVYSLTPAS